MTVWKWEVGSGKSECGSWNAGGVKRWKVRSWEDEKVRKGPEAWRQGSREAEMIVDRKVK